MSANNKPRFYITAVDNIDDALLRDMEENGESFIELLLLKEGYAVRNCGSGPIRVNSQEMHLSVCGRPCAVDEKDKAVDGWYCCFNSAFLKSVRSHEHLENEINLISSFLHRYPLRLGKQVFDRLHTNMLFIDRLYNKKPDYFLIYIYLLVCIYEMKKMMQDSSLDLYPTRAFYITERYGELLSTYIHREHSLDFYASQLNISLNHLNKSVRTVTGKTAIAMLNEARLAEAQRLLKETTRPIAEIAFLLGFDDPSYFSRFFKKLTGMRPGEYR